MCTVGSEFTFESISFTLCSPMKTVNRTVIRKSITLEGRQRKTEQTADNKKTLNTLIYSDEQSCTKTLLEDFINVFLLIFNF